MAAATRQVAIDGSRMLRDYGFPAGGHIHGEIAKAFMSEEEIQEIRNEFGSRLIPKLRKQFSAYLGTYWGSKTNYTVAEEAEKAAAAAKAKAKAKAKK